MSVPWPVGPEQRVKEPGGLRLTLRSESVWYLSPEGIDPGVA